MVYKSRPVHRISFFDFLNFRNKIEELMRFKEFLVLLSAILILNFSHIPFLRAAPRVQFSIVFTNDVMGEVEPCG
jgi:hypothetical protein